MLMRKYNCIVCDTPFFEKKKNQTCCTKACEIISKIHLLENQVITLINSLNKEYNAHSDIYSYKEIQFSSKFYEERKYRTDARKVYEKIIKELEEYKKQKIKEIDKELDKLKPKSDLFGFPK